MDISVVIGISVPVGVALTASGSFVSIINVYVVSLAIGSPPKSLAKETQIV